jgi:glucose/arabinose dehydrogenase
VSDRFELGRRGILLAGAAGVLAACSSSSGGGTTPSSAPDTGASEPTTPAPAGSIAAGAPPGTVSTVATGIEVPWGIGFLPNGDAVVAERETGHVLLIPAGTNSFSSALTLPDVDTDGTSEGGLLGLAVSPTYATDQLLYAYYSAVGDNRIVSFTLAGGSDSVKPILTGLLKGSIHNGGRIAFGPDGKLYAGVGETGERGLAQAKSSLNGKILRINADGSNPSDNPFSGSAIWSLGHRNPQGLAWDSAGRMWSAEFGQDTFDEVNLIEKGKNYGWPVVEGVGDTNGGEYTNPKVTWSTDEASPSGCAIIAGTMYIGALKGQCLLRVALSGTTATKQEPLVADDYGRLRTAVAAPDGSLWFTTSNRDGRGDPRPGDDHIFRLQL